MNRLVESENQYGNKKISKYQNGNSTNVLKMVLSIMVMLFILGASIGVADHTQLQLGMSLEEVEQITGKKAKINYGTLLITMDEKISNYDTEMSLRIYDNILVEKSCRFLGYDAKRNTGLFKAYQSKYGKPIGNSKEWNKRTRIPNEIGTILCLMRYGKDDTYDQEMIKESVLEGNTSFMIWEPDENTIIILYDDFGSMYISYYWQPYLFNFNTKGV